MVFLFSIPDTVVEFSPNAAFPKHSEPFGLNIPTTIPFSKTSPIFKV